MIPALLDDHAASPATARYWEAAEAGELAIQRCRACGHRQLPPRATCEACGGAAFEHETASGRGTVYAFTVVQRALIPELREHVPYVLALVDLAEGPRLTTLLRVPPADVAVGLPVVVAFERVGGVALPVFVLG